jgi:hypothetical protein
MRIELALKIIQLGQRADDQSAQLRRLIKRSQLAQIEQPGAA